MNDTLQENIHGRPGEHNAKMIKMSCGVESNRNLSFALMGQYIACKAFTSRRDYDFYPSFGGWFISQFVHEMKNNNFYKKWGTIADVVDFDIHFSIEKIFVYRDYYNSGKAFNHEYELILELPSSFFELLIKLTDKTFLDRLGIVSVLDIGALISGYVYFSDGERDICPENHNYLMEFGNMVARDKQVDYRSFSSMIYSGAGMWDRVSIDHFCSYVGMFEEMKRG